MLRIIDLANHAIYSGSFPTISEVEHFVKNQNINPGAGHVRIDKSNSYTGDFKISVIREGNNDVLASYAVVNGDVEGHRAKVDAWNKANNR